MAKMIGNTCRVGCGSKTCTCNPGSTAGRLVAKRTKKRRDRQAWKKEPDNV